MKELIEKIVERLGISKRVNFDCHIRPDYRIIVDQIFNDVFNIIQEEATAYNDGWIPCSERLPEEWEYYLVCDEQSVFIAEYSDYEWRYHSNENTKEYVSVNVTYWKSLPDFPLPYQPKGEVAR